MAKADLRKAETDQWREQAGRALTRAITLRGWTLGEFAAAVDRDARQCARWMNGQERVQLDVVLAIESLQQPFVQALAELTGMNVSVVIQSPVRRSA